MKLHYVAVIIAGIFQTFDCQCMLAHLAVKTTRTPRLTFKRTLPGRENKKQELPSTLARLGKQADDLDKKLLTCKNDVPERAIRAPYPYILCGTTLLSGALADGAPLMAGLLTIGVLEKINQIDTHS